MPKEKRKKEIKFLLKHSNVPISQQKVTLTGHFLALTLSLLLVVLHFLFHIYAPTIMHPKTTRGYTLRNMCQVVWAWC